MATERKKAYEVIPMVPNLRGIAVDGKMLDFGNGERGQPEGFITTDPGLAKQIEDIYGAHSKTGTRDVVVCEVDNAQGITPRKVFRMPELPWKRGKK